MERKIQTMLYANKDYPQISVDENTALIVIDIQEKLIDALEDSDKMITNTNALLKAFKIYDMPKLATEQYPKGLGKTIDEILVNLDKDHIYSKTTFDSITEEVYDYLEENEIEKVIIVGAEAHVCVFQTVRRLLMEEREVYLVEDAISSFSNNQKEVAMNLMKGMGAFVLNTEMILFDLAQDSKSEHFKEISNIIKEIRK
ncbi:MAG: isochorismatase family protein [Tissierellia bacterium]|nr:isochorismatase family protein [Tissierellia bacterium]